jgi:hypothetical protein
MKATLVEVAIFLNGPGSWKRKKQDQRNDLDELPGERRGSERDYKAGLGFGRPWYGSITGTLEMREA